MQRQISGSPNSEYLSRNHSWTSEINNLYQAEWWKQLQYYNQQSFRERVCNNTIPWFILTPLVVQIIFSICKHLQQADEVRFLTLEIFDRFITCHYLQLHSFVWDKTDTVDDIKHRHWIRVVERVRNQFILRIMSCMQLASKQVNHHERITSKMVSDFLKKIGYNFTLQSIVLSERRVFRTIEYKVKNLNLDILYSVSISVLDVAYIQHNEIFVKLFHRVTGRWDRTPKERLNFFAVECDNIFLACAVVACAANILEGNLATIMHTLQQESQLPLQDIEELSTIIKEIIFSNSMATHQPTVNS
ncbi:hypothetical protein C0J52_11609 [Blattella germanica]|nr:hypothetical protein C0J52_11609 [Blattella germanica]